VLTTTLFEVTSIPLDILIPENCATNRKIRVRLVRTVSSGHLLREYTHVGVHMCTDNPMIVRVCIRICAQNNKKLKDRNRSRIYEMFKIRNFVELKNYNFYFAIVIIKSVLRFNYLS